MTMDVLSDILDTLRLRGTLYFFTDFSRPWGVRVPVRGRVARFHLVVRGSCWVRVDGEEESVHLEPGDMILVPHGAEHVLADSPDAPVRSVDEVVEISGFTGQGALVYGGEDGGGSTRMVCGHFEFDEGTSHPLISQLPPSVVVRWDDEVRDSPLDDVFRFIAREVWEGRPGRESVVRRLSEVLFVQVIRAWANGHDQDVGILAALADPRLGEALSAMHADPAADWTLETLGQKAALGRTAFAERFREVVGETPLIYLTLWRMELAKGLLARSGHSVDRVAARVGYGSSASFSRAFKRTVGESPGRYRRHARDRGDMGSH